MQEEEPEEEDLSQAGITYMLYMVQGENHVVIKMMDDVELFINFVCEL